MDVVEQVRGIFTDATTWVQAVGISAVALAYTVGGFLQATGGQDGARKARVWYIGATIGLVVMLGGSSIAEFLQSKITF